MEVELAAEAEAVTTSSRGWVSGVRTKEAGPRCIRRRRERGPAWAQRNALGEKGKTEVRGWGLTIRGATVLESWSSAGACGDDLQALQQHNVFLSSKSSKSFEESWTRPGSKEGTCQRTPTFTSTCLEDGPHRGLGPRAAAQRHGPFPVANKAELQAGVSAARDRQGGARAFSDIFAPEISPLPPPPLWQVEYADLVEPRFDPEAAQKSVWTSGQIGRGMDRPRRVGERV